MVVPKFKDKNFDSIVVGAGVAGLLAAATQVRLGRSVLLLDAESQVGGYVSPELREGYQFGAGFQFQERDLWQRFFAKLEIPLELLELSEHKTKVFLDKKWKLFDAKSGFEQNWSKPTTFFPALGLAGVVEALRAYIQNADGADIVLNALVTSVSMTDDAYQIGVGADTELTTKHVLWCADEPTLQKSLRGDAFPEAGPGRVAWMRKFLKNEAQPGVVLEFAHKQEVSDFFETLCLPVTSVSAKEQYYMFGAFTSNRDSNLCGNYRQVSTWIFPLEEKLVGDNHEIMKRIRYARRQLEKAFPSFTDSVAFDRVQVLGHTATLPKKTQGKWNELAPGFYLPVGWASPFGSHYEGVLQVLDSYLAQEMGEQSETTSNESSEEAEPASETTTTEPPAEDSLENAPQNL